MLWICKSAAHPAEQLSATGHAASERTVNCLLHELGYSPQSNRKTLEGRQVPDRDRQFQRISERVREFQQRGDPVVVVDTKKKEQVGRCHNGGPVWRANGCPDEVRVHDFPDAELGKAIPYGVHLTEAPTEGHPECAGVASLRRVHFEPD